MNSETILQEEKPFVVLSLFDGISVLRQAFKNLEIPVRYYASEIDKSAIKISQYNHPDIIHLGDVCQITAEKLPEIPDLLCWGSPCNNFSSLGRREGLAEGTKSSLFFEALRIFNEVKEINPNVLFIMENVVMSNDNKNIISSHLGVQPIKINSALVSAQSRNRLYWTNIKGVEQPVDQGIFLKHILENGYSEKEKSAILTSQYCNSIGGAVRSYFTRNRTERQVIFNHPMSFERTLSASTQYLHYSVTATTDNKVYDFNFTVNNNWNYAYTKSLNEETVQAIKPFVRVLTIAEREQLQNLPVGYTDVPTVSNTARTKALGNSFTVGVIEHILLKIPFVAKYGLPKELFTKQIFTEEDFKNFKKGKRI